MTIEERLEAPEKEARRSRKMVRWLSALFILCVAAWIATSVFLPQGMVIARDVANEIRARKLVVVDEMGKERIVMNATPEPELIACDANGVPRFTITNSIVPTLYLFDKSERKRIAIEVFSISIYPPVLAMFDKDENLRIGATSSYSYYAGTISHDNSHLSISETKLYLCDQDFTGFASLILNNIDGIDDVDLRLEDKKEGSICLSPGSDFLEPELSILYEKKGLIFSTPFLWSTPEERSIIMNE